MSNDFNVVAELRSDLGKAHSRRMRRLDDKVPAVVYGGDKEPMAISVNHNVVRKSLENEAFYSHILTLNIGGKTEKAVLRAVQRHPYKPKIMHLDFMRISGKEKITMNVPLHFINEDQAPGVKTNGGIVSHLLTNVEVICLPDNLPEFITVDMSNLEVDQAIHLSQLKLPKGVELFELSHGHNNDKAVVSIHLPRTELEDTETPTPVTEVINEKPAEEE